MGARKKMSAGAVELEASKLEARPAYSTMLALYFGTCSVTLWYPLWHGFSDRRSHLFCLSQFNYLLRVGTARAIELATLASAAPRSARFPYSSAARLSTS